jgi:pyruvate dehydrogenase E1 component alpha subunit
VHEKKADPAFFSAVDAEADELAATVREGCLSMPDPTPESMFEHVYVEDHPLVQSERDQFVAYQAGFEGAHS